MSFVADVLFSLRRLPIIPRSTIEAIGLIEPRVASEPIWSEASKLFRSPSNCLRPDAPEIAAAGVFVLHQLPLIPTLRLAALCCSDLR